MSLPASSGKAHPMGVTDKFRQKYQANGHERDPALEMASRPLVLNLGSTPDGVSFGWPTYFLWGSHPHPRRSEQPSLYKGC